MTKEIEIDIPVHDLVRALNDPAYAEKLLKEKKWTKKMLIDKSQLLARQIANGVRELNQV